MEQKGGPECQTKANGYVQCGCRLGRNSIIVSLGRYYEDMESLIYDGVGETGEKVEPEVLLSKHEALAKAANQKLLEVKGTFSGFTDDILKYLLYMQSQAEFQGIFKDSLEPLVTMDMPPRLSSL